MSPEKLEALRRLAADERTPEEEARTAALTYVRNGGNVTARAVAPCEVDERIRVLESENERLGRACGALWEVVRKCADAYKAHEDAKRAMHSAGYAADHICRVGIPPKEKT